MATIAVFIALGGGAYAATQLDRNSVASKHIVNGQVKSVDVADDTFAEIGAWQEVGGSGEPSFGVSHDCSWAHGDLGGFNTVGFMREGSVIRLKGRATITETNPETSGCRDFGGRPRTPPIFNLPAGYRPERTEMQLVIANGDPATLQVHPNGDVQYTGSFAGGEGAFFGVWIDGVAFRCAPSGQDGCP